MIRILALLLLVSCGEFIFSPYLVDIRSENSNLKNLNSLLSTPESMGAGNDFSVVVISDTHDYYDSLKDQINYINKNMYPDFVFITGDMSNVGLVGELEKTKSILDRLKVPYLVTSGNHDLLIDGEYIFEKIFGQDTYSFTYKGVRFVALNNNNWESKRAVPNISWLKSQIEYNIDDNVIIFAHIPYDDQERFTQTMIETWQNLFVDYKVDYYINGHDHNTNAVLLNDTTQVTVGSSSKRGLLNLIFNADGVSHEIIKI